MRPGRPIRRPRHVRACAAPLLLTGLLAACAPERPETNAVDGVTKRAGPATEPSEWKPPKPPKPPTSCGVGCIEGRGRAVARFQLAAGEHTASLSVEDNRGVFAIGPPVEILEEVTDWSSVTTFRVREAGVYPIRIHATGNWRLGISKGKLNYVEQLGQ